MLMINVSVIHINPINGSFPATFQFAPIYNLFTQTGRGTLCIAHRIQYLIQIYSLISDTKQSDSALHTATHTRRMPSRRVWWKIHYNFLRFISTTEPTLISPPPPLNADKLFYSHKSYHRHCTTHFFSYSLLSSTHEWCCPCLLLVAYYDWWWFSWCCWEHWSCCSS